MSPALFWFPASTSTTFENFTGEIIQSKYVHSRAVWTGLDVWNRFEFSAFHPLPSYLLRRYLKRATIFREVMEGDKKDRSQKRQVEISDISRAWTKFREVVYNLGYKSPRQLTGTRDEIRNALTRKVQGSILADFVVSWKQFSESGCNTRTKKLDKQCSTEFILFLG